MFETKVADFEVFINNYDKLRIKLMHVNVARILWIIYQMMKNVQDETTTTFPSKIVVGLIRWEKADLEPINTF